MSLARTFRFVALVAPLLLFALVLTLPYHSARLSLILHGYPFARVVPKEKLDIFQYVQTDSFSYKAVVFSDGKAVGMIDQPTGAFACFVSLAQANVDVDDGFPMMFNALLSIAWFLRWWLLPAQVVLLLLWLRTRQRKVCERERVSPHY